MTGYVAFLRAINVSGHARVKMRDLKEAFAAAGCQDLQSVIQSGNVIFNLPRPRAQVVFRGIRQELAALVGHGSVVFFRRRQEIRRRVEEDPFQEIERRSDAKLYVAFLYRDPPTRPRFPLRSPKECLEAIGMRDLEVFLVSGRKENGFYGFPNNFIEKEFGVPATSRNWSTVTKIARLAGG